MTGVYALQKHLIELSRARGIPEAHENYLVHLKQSGFEPKVIYDIGCCVLHGTRIARRLWPDAAIFVFNAFPLSSCGIATTATPSMGLGRTSNQCSQVDIACGWDGDAHMVVTASGSNITICIKISC